MIHSCQKEVVRVNNNKWKWRLGKLTLMLLILRISCISRNRNSLNIVRRERKKLERRLNQRKVWNKK